MTAGEDPAEGSAVVPAGTVTGAAGEAPEVRSSPFPGPGDDRLDPSTADEVRRVLATYRSVAASLFEPQSRLDVARALQSEVADALGARRATVYLSGRAVGDPSDELRPIELPGGCTVSDAAGPTGPDGATVVDGALDTTLADLAERSRRDQRVVGPSALSSGEWSVAVPLADGHGSFGSVLYHFAAEPVAATQVGWFDALATECREALERARLWEVKAELRQRAERDESAVASSERRLRQVLDGLFVFVGLLDAEGTLLEANRAALDVGGMTPEDVLGRPFWETEWWSWDRGVQDRLRAAIEAAAEGRSSRFEAEVRVLGDARIIIDFQLVPLRDEDGRITHLVPSALDITEQKREEAEREARLAEQRQATERAQAMQALAEAAGAVSDSEEVYDAVAKSAAAAVGAFFANLGIRQVGSDQVQLRNGPGLPGAVAQRWPEIDINRSTPITEALRSGRIAWAEDPTEITAKYPTGAADAAAAGLQALGAIPVTTAGGEVVAAIGLAWTHPQPLTGALRVRVTSLAAVVGQALERARRFDAERHVAQALQRFLLPARLPRFPTVRLTARYRAAESTLAVGGDWYECLETGDGRLIVALGDVVGRGIEAAATVGQLRAAVTALAPGVDSPASLLARLDDFVGHFPAAVYTTMVCVELTLTTGAFRYACAGHPPPLLIAVDGASRYLTDGRSTPLGLVGGTRAEHEGAIGPGERLLLYTDGLIERRGERIDVGLDRLRDTVALEYSSDDDRFVDDVLRHATPPNASDDVCLLLLHRWVTPDDLQLWVRGGAAGLSATRRALSAWLTAVGVRGMALDEVVLAVGEALANSVEHAYLDHDEPGEVRLEATRHGHVLEIIVRDRGRWREVPAPGPRGRGLLMMRRIMDDVAVEPSESGTTLVLRRSLEDTT